MRLLVFTNDSLSKIPDSLTSLLLPKFNYTFFKSHRGNLLIQSFSNAQNSIWRFDFDLKEEITTKFVDDFKNFRFLLMETGTVFLAIRRTSICCGDNSAMIVKVDGCKIRIPPGKTTFWLMNPKNEHYKRLSRCFTKYKERVALIPFRDLSVNTGSFRAPGKDALDNYLWEAGINLVYATILQQFQPKAIDHNSLYSKYQEAIKLRSYLLENYGNSIIFYKLKINPTLRNSFAELYKTTPGRYLKEIRILAAERLLRDTKMKVEEVAWEVGYHQSAFTRIFTCRMGVSPTEYRQLMNGFPVMAEVE